MEVIPARNSPENSIHTNPKQNKKNGLTLGQKRALIENLQLEITERARRLRAQYVLQAQGLRTRIEIRVNRIPTALRHVEMGDLLLKHSKLFKQERAGPSKSELKSPNKNFVRSVSRISPSPHRSKKRPSDAITVDKENDLAESSRKRPHLLQETHSQKPPEILRSQVLSPRSANSRTIPKSPLRLASSTKPRITRAASPSKPSSKVQSSGSSEISKNIVVKSKTNRNAITASKTSKNSSVAGGRGKRTVPSSAAQRMGKGRASVISQSSDSSSNTVRRLAPAKKAQVNEKVVPAKKKVLGTIKSIGAQKKNTAAAKGSKSSALTTSGRVLRNRK